MNDIGVAEIEFTRPIFFDPYAEDRATGNFILIDLHTNATLAAGMIRRSTAMIAADASHHKAALLSVSNPEQASELEAALLAENLPVVRTRVQSPAIWRALLSLGLLVILEDIPTEHATAGLDLHTLEDLDPNAVTEFLQHLRDKAILPQKQNQEQQS